MFKPGDLVEYRTISITNKHERWIGLVVESSGELDGFGWVKERTYSILWAITPNSLWNNIVQHHIGSRYLKKAY